jgi:hypothetical protein
MSSASELKGKFEQAIKGSNFNFMKLEVMGFTSHFTQTNESLRLDAAPKKIKKERVWTPNQGQDGFGAHSTPG